MSDNPTHHESDGSTQWTFHVESCQARHQSGLTFTFARTAEGHWIGTVGQIEASRPDLVDLHRREGDAALKRELDPLLNQATVAYNRAGKLLH